MIRKLVKNPKFSLIGIGVAIVCMIGVSTYSMHKTKEAENIRAASQALAKTKPGSAASQALSPDQQFKQYMSFERDMRRFLRDQDTMTPGERGRQAGLLSRRIDEREKHKQLSAGEAVKLKMALIRATEPNEQKQAERIAELIALYQSEAERRETAFVEAQQRDPKFQAYKAREAQIVAEVQAMRSIPNGMSRDEYLRQRLLEARAAIYYSPQNGEPTNAP